MAGHGRPGGCRNRRPGEDIQRIEDYPGFPAGTSGATLAQRAVIQAGNPARRITVPARPVALKQDDSRHAIRLDDRVSIARPDSPDVGRWTLPASWHRPGSRKG